VRCWHARNEWLQGGAATRRTGHAELDSELRMAVHEPLPPPSQSVARRGILQ